ncbi:MAG: hypothetical protein ACJ79N_04380, partial [Gemmatimonadaceae bacterium]
MPKAARSRSATKSPRTPTKKTARKSATSPTRKPATEALVLVGTMKGAFIFRSDSSRRSWEMEGPHFRGEAVYALLHDNRGGRSRTFASATSMHWGPTLRISDDLGATWS